MGKLTELEDAVGLVLDLAGLGLDLSDLGLVMVDLGLDCTRRSLRLMTLSSFGTTNEKEEVALAILVGVVGVEIVGGLSKAVAGAYKVSSCQGMSTTAEQADIHITHHISIKHRNNLDLNGFMATRAPDSEANVTVGQFHVKQHIGGHLVVRGCSGGHDGVAVEGKVFMTPKWVSFILTPYAYSFGQHMPGVPRTKIAVDWACLWSISSIRPWDLD
ncbi:hypothetical protein K439DRAFT_1618670 [Ramaria rubella]|nr:hypothetical protein K439DRAFT_1618670 [Ramaria rubella]